MLRIIQQGIGDQLHVKWFYYITNFTFCALTKASIIKTIKFIRIDFYK